jgi:hypothetical protein
MPCGTPLSISYLAGPTAFELRDLKHKRFGTIGLKSCWSSNVFNVQMPGLRFTNFITLLSLSLANIIPKKSARRENSESRGW